jgi:hypothetical protein
MTPAERLEYLAKAKEKYDKHLIGVRREKAGAELLRIIKQRINEHKEILQEEYPDNWTEAMFDEYKQVLDDTPEFWEAIKEYVEWII